MIVNCFHSPFACPELRRGGRVERQRGEGGQCVSVATQVLAAAPPGRYRVRPPHGHMNYASDLAPLAPLRGEGLGVRGFERVSLHCIERCALARCAPSSPALLPRKAGGEGSQSVGFLRLAHNIAAGGF
jgi:hypothetical protein